MLKLMDNHAIVKAHGVTVRAQVSRVVELRYQYKLTISQLAKRFNVSEHLIKDILRKANG